MATFVGMTVATVPSVKVNAGCPYFVTSTAASLRRRKGMVNGGS
jgi:hypothetical protein